jgi:hypothetical protein
MKRVHGLIIAKRASIRMIDSVSAQPRPLSAASRAVLKPAATALTRPRYRADTDSMRLMLAVNVSLVLLVTGVGISSAAERHWQTGTWKDIGKRRDLGVGGAAPFGTKTIPLTAPTVPEVGTYVIETSDLRLELADTTPFGSSGAFDASVTVGASVTFAVDKNVAYIRNRDGSEHRLRIIKKIAKESRQSIDGVPIVPRRGQ